MIPGRVWGVTPAERAAEFYGDTLLSGPVTICDRAVAVDAPADLVFAWICQLRRAPYSYDLLDNFGRRSPRRRDPHLTELAVGQRFMSLFELVAFTRGAEITLRSRSCVVTYSATSRDAGARLHTRVRFRGRGPLVALLAAGDFLMMRKQLLTLRDLAEHEASQ